MPSLMMSSGPSSESGQRTKALPSLGLLPSKIYVALNCAVDEHIRSGSSAAGSA